MNKISFENGKEPAINAFNLNKIQENAETAINEVANNLDTTDSKFNFSTTEKVIGTWINGKPLYQKTITGTVTSVTAQVAINIGVENVELVTKLEGFTLYGTADLMVPLNFYNNENLRSYAYASKGSVSLYYKSNDFLNKPIYITIQYTKTTD